MEFIAVKTRVFNPPKDDLYKLIKDSIDDIQEGDILFITSKIVAVHQGRCIDVNSISKDELVKQEADYILPSHKLMGHSFTLTIKGNILLPSSGIDQSNADGYYILWPENIQETCKEIWKFIRKEFSVKNVGIVLTDSTTQALKRGTIGRAIGFFGINPLKSYIGSEDIFGKKMQVTKRNLIDPLASMAVYLMGEGNEQIPILIGRDIPHLEFVDKDMSEDFLIDPESDLYYPLLKDFIKL